jgi:hypothetical protein
MSTTQERKRHWELAKPRLTSRRTHYQSGWEEQFGDPKEVGEVADIIDDIDSGWEAADSGALPSG